ncbi:MAG: DUF2007 domain-containing protein [Chloroflexi bacterium]|nr:DUF2007 domain-containing protein [Chloroflexota bacterium]
MSRDRRRKQVSLTAFDNEPTARMAEQRLQLEGIPCFIRSLRGGPGLWGSAYNLPHDLLVYEDDAMRAREVLDIAPREILERERQGRQPPAPRPQWIVTGAIVLVVAFMALAVVIANRAIR